MNSTPLIGIVGGMGPSAGFDLANKILDQTLAEKDQDHIPLAILSCPSMIEDRTAYLLNPNIENPAYAIVEIIIRLKKIGAEVIGIPCNTAHSSPIFSLIKEELSRKSVSVRLIDMIHETMEFLSVNHPEADSIGLMTTEGSYKFGVYTEMLEKNGYRVILPDRDRRKRIHEAIYDSEKGVKALSRPVTAWACNNLCESIKEISSQGADCVILGCTEISLAVSSEQFDSIELIDPTLILARALIRETYPEKLKLLRNESIKL